jgi:hypothetical protein
MNIQELGKRFKRYFGFNPPIDMISTMKTYVELKFGSEALTFLNNNL